MSDRIGAAVLGLGVGRQHAQAYDQLETAELVAVCDSQEERLGPVAEQYGCRAYTSLDDLLADKNVELISVATPHKSHAALAIRCMRAGKHVIVEKPMTVDVAEAEQMIAVSQETGRTLATVFQRRYWPAALKAKATIDAGKIGTPILGIAQVSFYPDRVVLRARRLARELGARGRRGADEPGHPHRGHVPVADGRRAGGGRRAAGPT